MSKQTNKARREAERLHARRRAERDARAMADARRILDEVQDGTFVGHVDSWLIRQVAGTEAYQRGDPAARALGQRAAEVVARFEQDEAYQERCRVNAASAIQPFTRYGRSDR